MIIDDFLADGRGILAADVDDTDENIGMIPVYKDGLRKQFQLFQDKI